MAHKEKLGRDSEGRFRRYLGWKPGNGRMIQHLFRMGRDEAEAERRNGKLETLWSLIEARHLRRKEVGLPTDAIACWDDSTLQIGSALAAGKTELVLTPPTGLDDPAAILSWFAKIQKDFGSLIPLRVNADLAPARQQLRDQAAGMDEAAQTLQDRADVASGLADFARKRAGDRPLHTVTLFKALEGYAEAMVVQYTGPEGLTDYGKLIGRIVLSLKDHLQDRPLHQVDTPFLNSWKNQWENRPLTKRGKPASVEWAKKCIKIVNQFIDWLHGSAFDWSIPQNFKRRNARIKTTDEEVAATKRVRYKRDELVTLWRYATPLERVFISLALNCGFGNGEIATLRMDEVNLDKGIIKRNRRKTAIGCWWKLWDETIDALKFYLEKVRPETDSPYVFVTAEGRPYRQKTSGGNNSQVIPNSWARLYQRIIKDDPAFINLSFNKLRKTGSNWLRRKHGTEIAQLYLSHGSKEVVDHYAAKPYKLMNQAVRRYRKLLTPLFAAVEVPFPEDNRKSNPSLSLGIQNKIREMRRGGYKYRYIKETLGVSYDTIRRYSK